MPHTSEDLSEVWQGQIEASIQLGWRWVFFFTSAGDFRQVHGHHQWMNGQEVLAMGSPVIEDLAEGVSQTSTVWHRTLLWDTRTAIFYSSTPEHQRWACNRMVDRISCLLNVIFGCVSTEISIQFFDPVLPEPNRIFGLLNLSDHSLEFLDSTFPKKYKAKKKPFAKIFIQREVTGFRKFAISPVYNCTRNFQTPMSWNWPNRHLVGFRVSRLIYFHRK